MLIVTVRFNKNNILPQTLPDVNKHNVTTFQL